MISLDELKTLRLSHLCIAITFFTCGLAVNIVQLLLHLIVKPINKDIFRRLMYYVCYSFYSQLLFITDWYTGSELHVYIDPEVAKKYLGKEHVLLIMNHTYEIDWLAGWMLTEKIGVLGNCKAYAKKVISYVPIIGWAWKMAEFVFLERSFEKDKVIIAEQLKVIYSYPDPTWLLLNAEGTRFTPEKHKASVKFAQDRGMAVLKHHLIPRTKGFIASLPSLRGRCPAIYDINLAFRKDASVPPTMLTLLNGRAVEPHMYVRRIPLENVPEDEEKAAQWLQNLFIEKDRIIDSFHETGSFFTKSELKQIQSKVYNRRITTLINYIAWATLSISSILYYLFSCLIAQNWAGLFTGLGVLFIFYFLMEKALNMSKISKASTYGATSTSKINTN